MNAEHLNLLILEDEAAHVEAILQSFEKADTNVEIRTVGTLREFRTAVAERLPDVALIDLNLPDGKGLEILALTPEAVPFPILVMTAFGSQELVVEVMKAGALNYVVKSPEAFASMPETLDRAFREWGLIQKHKKAEVALRESETRYRTMFEDAQDGMGLTDAETGQLVDCNRALCRMVEREKEELVGQPQSLLHLLETDACNASQTFPQHRIGTPGKALEDRVLSKSGTWVPVEIRAVRIRMNGRDFLLEIFRDTTERKRTEAELARHRNHLEELVQERTQQLEEANTELDAFMYSVSHDLKAPLRALNGFSRILVEEASSCLGKEARHAVDVISASSLRMARLIDELLAFSRLGRLSVATVPTDMKAIAVSVCDELKNDFPFAHNVHWDIQELPEALADPALIHQVFENLIANALKFTRLKEPAHIEIGSSFAESETIYFVRDNGAGFDMRYVGKLFGVFQRLHVESEFEGTGAGLAIVQRVVHKHGGRAWAEGKVGEGATFYFSLPGSPPRRRSE